MTVNQGQKERLKLFIESLNITTRAFEEKSGLSNGYVNAIRRGVGYKALELISNSFPQLNSTWLVTGSGSMLKDYNVQSQELVSEEPKVMFKIGALSNSVIKHNIKLYLSYSGITKSKFCQETGVPLDILDKEGGVDEENIAKILSRYENINPEWLIMGKGKMIRETLKSDIIKHPPNPDSIESINTNLRGRIERLLSIIENQQDVIKNYCDIIQKQQDTIHNQSVVIKKEAR